LGINFCLPIVSTTQASPVPAPPTVSTTDSHAPHLPELLAPAGDWECARAAVENGADAIYFGLERFNARMRAHNFTEADLPPLVEYLHRRGVKAYVTFNTLVFENELTEAEQYARTIIASGVDAAIIQDVGICRLIRKLSDDFPIHVSTQMTITSAAGIEFCRQLGCNLIVLARECSLKEIEQIQAAQNGHPLPLEVFVHGALCVAYSGQCLTSEALGGRSANRGECAQACRMPYDLVSDGRLVPLGDRKYLLSPQDLAGLPVLPELVRLGVASLKIEGRLKSPEYVANITRVYRQELQRLANARAGRFTGSELMTPKTEDRARDTYEMEMAFSRGLYTGWFGGTNNQELVHGRFGKKRGVFLGTVTEVLRDAVKLRLEGPLKPGDGVVFDAGKPEEREEGGRIYEIRPVTDGREGARSAQKNKNGDPGSGRERIVMLAFGRGDIDFSRVHAGDKLWKTSDPELERRLRQSFEGNTPRFQRLLSFEVHGCVGKPLTVTARDDLGHIARRDSTMPLVAAHNQPLTLEKLRDQLGRLGGTAFRLGGVQIEVTGDVLIPLGELNRLRRELVAELDWLRAQPCRWHLREQLTANESGVIPTAVAANSQPQLIVLVRTLPQMEAAFESGIRTIYCEFEDPKRYRDAVAQYRTVAADVRRRMAGDIPQDSPPPHVGGYDTGGCGSIWVAPPRIFKMGEEWTLKQVRSCDADGYLVRNYDHLRFFSGERVIGDYSLNVSNRLSAAWFKERFALERVTASYDLNFTQLEALLRAAPPEWFEVTIHQHMPMFHMEHCVFCAFLSTGTDYTNCGRPCDRHQLSLRDRVGAEHPVKADVGCRNTVFNALAQTGAEYVDRMLALGVRHFRVEFLNETPEQVTCTIGKYRQLLKGEITGAQLWRELKLFNQLGVTRGQMAGQRH
jgi:U32 family peptidase